MKKKTLGVSLILIFLIVFSTILVYNVVDTFGYLYTSEELELGFYSNKLDESKTNIFLVGNSQVWRINMTYLNDELSKVCPNCEVYNLGVAADKPSNRIKSLGPMIGLNPDLIVYGVGFPDFAFQERVERKAIQQIEKPDSILPDPESLFHNGVILPNFPNQVNPKFFSLSAIKTVIEGKQETKKVTPDPNDRPFKVDKDFDEEDYLVFDNEQLARNRPDLIEENKEIDPEILEKNVNALENMVEEFSENDIKVVLFSTPTSNAILKEISEADQQIFEETLKNISEKSNVNYYFLHKKFSDYKIFSDPLHVTLSDEGIPYTEEILRILIDEVERF